MTLDDLKVKGLYKAERRIESPQKAGIIVNGHEVVNFCANNYLGLANHPAIVSAAAVQMRPVWGWRRRPWCSCYRRSQHCSKAQGTDARSQVG